MTPNPRQPRFPSWLITAASAASLVLLAGCGGGGSSDSAVGDVMLPTLAAPKSCNNVAGGLDAVQSAILGQLVPAALNLPVVGMPAGGAATSLSQTLDTVDALTTALSDLARTQSAQQFTTQLGGAGDSLLCAASSLSGALAQLAAAQTLPIPGVSTIQQSLALLTQRISTGLVGTTPGGDLTLITAQLVTVARQVQSLSTSLPTAINQPGLATLLALNANTFNSVALILGDVGALNGSKLAVDVTGLLTSTAQALPTSSAGQLGLPINVLGVLNTQLGVAAQALSGSLAAVTSPTLQAVSAVLGGVNAAGGAAAVGSFSDLLAGGLDSSASAASLTRLTQLTQLLGGTGSTNLLTALLGAFGGRLPI